MNEQSENMQEMYMEDDLNTEDYSETCNFNEHTLQLPENDFDKITSSDKLLDRENLPNTSTADNSESTKQEVVKFTKLPMARIKNIMKMDPDVNLASSDAVFAVTKATEMFIEAIAKEAYSYTAKAKKKIITKKDFDSVIENVDCLYFLEGAMDF